MNGLRSFLFFNDVSQIEVAEYLGISKGQMSKLVSGASNLRVEQLEKLLMNDKGWNTEFLTNPAWTELESAKSRQEKKGAGEKAGIPLIPVEAFAGKGEIPFGDIANVDYYIVNEFSGSDFLIRVKGDSMSPKFTGGDIVACRKVESWLFFQWGRVYVLSTKSQGVMIKRVQPSDREDCVRCVSENEKYAPFDVPKSDIEALALVNGSISLE